MTQKPLDNTLLANFSAGDIEGFEALVEIALDMRWSWNHAADQIWRRIDHHLWEQSHNPWDLLQTVSRNKIAKVLTDPHMQEKINSFLTRKRHLAEKNAWFQENHLKSNLKQVAYFSMEYMLSDVLPIYSGGLGNVAGDQLKASSDLGVPVIAIGILYQQGYFRQVIDKDGSQLAFFPSNNIWQVPVRPLRTKDGEWLRLKLDLKSLPLWIRVWQVQVGRNKLYLLDSNDPANYPPHRGITSQLYVSDPVIRVMQEIILGIGGWKLLSHLEHEPEVCHLNEGHTAFAVLERAREFMEKSEESFEVALSVTRAGNIFTTHTTVPAGFDMFEPQLIEHFLKDYAEEKLGIKLYDLLALGRLEPHNPHERFSVANLAMRGSGMVNGVSKLHGEISKNLFKPLFPGWDIQEIPITYVTNGVHMPSWDSAIADELWTKTCGKSRWLGETDEIEKEIQTISDKEMWNFRIETTKVLIDFIRKRLEYELQLSGASQEEMTIAKHVFNPSILTIGFARRFAAYKRLDLLLHNKERLIRLLTNPERPVQLILAGKAHPADHIGQEKIKEWVQFIKKNNIGNHVVFLSDHDKFLTEKLVQGVDLWLNTPRRPFEACGTSGMKALVNGGLNLSVLDGWWAEAYSPEVGWAIESAVHYDNEHVQDTKEAESLYDILENQVIPEFYTRNENDIPTAWVQKMRESMARLTAKYSTNRVVRQYVDEYYIPAAESFCKRAKDNGAIGGLIVNRKHALQQKWCNIKLSPIRIKTADNNKLCEVNVELMDLDPDYIRVQLYLNNKPTPKIVDMNRSETDSPGQFIYSAICSQENKLSDLSIRIIPNYLGLNVPVNIPLEDSHILWAERGSH